MRRLGLSLPQIARALDSAPELGEAIRSHLAQVRDSIEHQRRLAGTLTRILDHLADRREPAVEDLITAIEGIIMTDRYFTPEQHDDLARRADALGADGMHAAEARWARLIDDVRAEQAAGTDPRGARMQELAREWKELIEAFTGGDEATLQSLRTMYRLQGPADASQGMVDPELMAYVGQALSALAD